KLWYKKEHTDTKNLKKAVYGLPELNREAIRSEELKANRGCYPTGIILALAPIMKMVADAGIPVIIDSKSGASGAGRKAAIPLSFCEVDENFKCYKANDHQHMPEIEHILSKETGKDVKVNFAPHLLPLKRGILSTIYIQHKGLPDEKELYELYSSRYGKEPFVRLRAPGLMPEMQEVAHTNFCDIGFKVARGMLIMVSVIDNLMKGASGQAVQNMNIMCGLDEASGLLQ
ncbi:MAG: N-acetyl-gamma-glutamyl-phosphate reductase, partial [Candidatus Omnitrophota bacterium]